MFIRKSSLVTLAAGATILAAEPDDCPKLVRISQPETVLVRWQGQTQQIIKGQRLGNWTFMAVIQADAKHPMAVFEDFSQTTGRLVLTGEDGNEVDLPK